MVEYNRKTKAELISVTNGIVILGVRNRINLVLNPFLNSNIRNDHPHMIPNYVRLFILSSKFCRYVRH